MTANIWEFCKDQVDNKGVLERIGHSARFHPMRSAVNSPGSFGSKFGKFLGSVGRSACNLIPIPVFGTLVAAAESAIENKIRSYCHKQHTDPSDKVKFALKEVSVENLDRYRFKVTHSVDEVKAQLDIFNVDAPNAADQGSQCVPEYQLALKIAQAERRIEIFENEVNGLLIIMQASITWAEAAKASIVDAKNKVNVEFAKVAAAEAALLSSAVTTEEQTAAVAAVKARHVNCCGSWFSTDFCNQRDNIAHGNWSAFRAGAAAVVRELQAPFSAESFMAMDRTNFENAGRVANYGAAPPPAAP